MWKVNEDIGKHDLDVNYSSAALEFGSAVEAELLDFGTFAPKLFSFKHNRLSLSIYIYLFFKKEKQLPQDQIFEVK